MPMTVLMQARTLACLLVCLSPVMVEAATGRTATDFGVSPSGEASYSIPIVAPPGTHGMTPQMALVYGHRNGSTLVGAGWSIAGLSSIYRCASSWAADGVARDVRNDATDRFCLDGNKLRLTGGTYGQAGATYQTEIETFSRATSSGAAGNGPAYFIVETRDGLIYEYGNTADSRIESVGQATARAWAVNKITDRSGNAIDFVYTEDATNGAYRIARIDYTSNADRSLSAAYRIEFVWQTKPSNEIDSGYIAGGVVRQITRLDRIDVTYNSAIVRRYELTYESALSSTSKSRLQSIQECAGTELDCYPSTAFAYQNGVPGLGDEISTGASVPVAPWPLDVNGDGRSDLVYSSSATSGTGTWQVILANASGGYSAAQETGVTNTNYGGAIPIDYNADGLEDLLVPYAAGTWWVMLGGASGLGSPTDTGAPATGTGSRARAIDVNGDGLDDLVWADLVGYAGGDAIRYRLREWGGAFSSAVYYLAGPYAADWMIESGVFGSPGQRSRQRVPDVNGDGRGDLIFRYSTRQWIDGTSTWKYFRRIGVICPGSSGATITTTTAGGTPYYGDFNGDGKSDLLYLNDDGYYVVRFSTGAGLTGEVSVVYLGSYFGDPVILDWDSDGKDDVLLAGANGWSVVRATGEGFVAPANTGLSAGTSATVMDLNGDGLSEIAASVGGTWRYRLHAGPLPDLLQSATDGYDNQVTFNYTPISQGSYTKGSGADFPEMDYMGALSVVNSASASDGIGGTYTRSFGYAQARMQLQGRGFEGFATRSSVDSRNGIQVTESRAQLFPYTGMMLESVVRQPTSNASKEISRQTHTLQSHQYSYSGAHARALPYVSTSTATRREVGGIYDGALISTTTVSNSVHQDTGLTYDTTVTTTEAPTGNGAQPGASYVQRVQLPLAYLFNDTTNWCIGRPGRIESTNSHNQYGGAAITRTTAISWDSAEFCRPAQTTSEPDDPALQVVRSLSYDDFGNVDAETVTAAGMAGRTTQIYWGTTGQFPKSMTDALGKSSAFEWYYSLGQKKKQTDPNDVETTWQYDDFGRQTLESRQGSIATTLSYSDCSTVGCVNSNNKLVVVQSILDSAGAFVTDQWVYFDRFDRPQVTRARTLSGGYSRTDREYDAQGRFSRESAPCWWGACSYFWTTMAYDLVGRVSQVSRPKSDSDSAPTITGFYYEGLTSRVVDAMGKPSVKVSNVLGALTQSVDAYQYFQHFDYDAFGNVVRVTDSLGGTLLQNTFNRVGMRTAQTDLAAGSWSYVPNALGEIISQTDARSQTTSFGYDALGRLISRTEPEGTSTFTFGSSATDHNIGRLASMSGPGYAESYTYDSLGRLQQRSISADATYSLDYTYNTFGAVHTLTYPATVAGERLTVQYDYEHGLPKSVRDAGTAGTVFWTANDTDARGSIVSETLGNGIQTVRGYDQVTGLIDYIQSFASSTIQDLAYEWDAAGNLTQRMRQDGRPAVTEDFTYDDLHRLTGVMGPEPLSIGYDNQGNIVSRSGDTVSSGTSHTVTWYSYNLPNTIGAEAGNASQFYYAPDRSRWKQEASYGGTPEQTIYVGGVMEKVTLGTTTAWKQYISGATGPVAIYTRKSTGATEIHYLTKDHLGSVDSVISAAGAIEARLFFGAHGQRRNEATWAGNPTSGDWSGITNTTRRGFTSHEMLDNLNLTHMNGRVYDQSIGRFISPDPFIDGPKETQGWNRYSYVHNRPLSFTDPSGFEIGTNVRPDDPNNRSYSYGEFMDMARGGFNGIMGGMAPAPRPDLWSLRRPFVLPGAEPWPDWNTPPTDTPRPMPPPRGLGNGGESTGGGVDDLQSGYVFSFQPRGMRTGIISYHLQAIQACELQRSCGGAVDVTPDILLAILPFGRPFAPGFSRLSVAGGLGAHEGVLGGHTLARHVNIGSLAQRLIDEPLISAASKFASREIAEASIGTALDVNQSLIRSWLQSSGGSLAVSYRFAAPIGETLVRGASGATPASSVTVILRRYPGFPEGFRIHTAFPGM